MQTSLPGTRAFVSETRQTTVPGLPHVTRVYQNHHLDSTRWDVYEPRDGDIVIVTSYKSGTTWMEQILGLLLLGDSSKSVALHGAAPWVDSRFRSAPKEDLRKIIAGLPGRRLLKSHLPLDGLPFYKNVRYVIVCRDPRDVFMSLFNHYRNYTDFAFTLLNDPPDRIGQPFPPCPDNPRAFWREWMTRGFFDWESEGWPFWSNLGHTQSFWNYRHLPNFLFVHYADMLADLAGAVRRVAVFADIDVCDADVARVVKATTFSNVKKKADELPADSDRMRMVFKGGMSAFFFKGSNGRWRDILSEDDLAIYAETKARVLSPDCVQWLEEGGVVRR